MVYFMSNMQNNNQGETMKLNNVDAGWISLMLTAIIILVSGILMMSFACAEGDGVGFGDSINITIVRANATLNGTLNQTQMQNETSLNATQHYRGLFTSFGVSSSQTPFNQTPENAPVEPAVTPEPTDSTTDTATDTPAAIGAPDYTTIWIFFGVLLVAAVGGLFFWRKVKNEQNQKADYGYFRS